MGDANLAAHAPPSGPDDDNSLLKGLGQGKLGIHTAQLTLTLTLTLALTPTPTLTLTLALTLTLTPTLTPTPTLTQVFTRRSVSLGRCTARQ